MSIYGTTLVSICLLAGMLFGKLLAMVIGIEGNIGGVGLAMLFLIVVGSLVFWSSIYVPIVVAMAASQDVVRAIDSGAMAVIAGLVSVLVSFALFPAVKILTASEDQ